MRNRLLPFDPEEYWQWKEKLEAGYGQPRPGVSSEQVERERAVIPDRLRHTYIMQKYLASKKEEQNGQ